METTRIEPLTVESLASINPGEKVQARSGSYSVDVARFVLPDHDHLGTNVHIRSGETMRANNLGPEIEGRMAIGTHRGVAVFVDEDQALELAGEILKALPVEVTEAFIRTLVDAFVS